MHRREILTGQPVSGWWGGYDQSVSMIVVPGEKEDHRESSGLLNESGDKRVN
jgi:hypothetical protein